MRLALILLFVSSAISLTLGQTFTGEASLPAVESDGFYRIAISPQVSPYFNSDFSNIRIYDQKNKEVPYLLHKESPMLYSQKFKEYEIVEKVQSKNCCTSLTLRNLYGRAINNISLLIKNAEVLKQATLLGSDDKKNWFALKQHFTLNAINNRTQTSEIKIVDFPLSNYTYYLLQIEDSTSAPINILSAGYYETQSEDGKYTEVSSLKVTKSDSAKQKRTYVKIVFDTIRVVDKLIVSMTGEPYFLRKASLFNKIGQKNKKGMNEFYYDRLSDFELSSKQPSIIELPGVRTFNLLVVIENQDNPSIEVASTKAFQLNRDLTAWLKRENHYTLKIGEPDILPPTYDLNFFKDSIPENPQTLAIGPVTIFEEKEPQPSTTIFTSKSVIWVAIGLLIIILGFMSIKLIRETGPSAKKND